jgi:hypothetical protein
MLAVMFSLNWKFTLVALAVAPLLALFVYRLRSVVKAAHMTSGAAKANWSPLCNRGWEPFAS